jgi:hypothetical protein
MLGIPSLAEIVAAWRDTPVWLVGTVAVLVLGFATFSVARHALRRASARIDTILAEELGANPPAAVRSLADHREPLIEPRVSGAMPRRR